MQNYTHDEIDRMRKEDEIQLIEYLPDENDRKLLLSLRYDLLSEDFEKVIARWYTQQGRSCTVQGGYDDEGIDIVATKEQKNCIYSM